MWILETAEQELLQCFQNFIVEYEAVLQQKEIFIWGASVRGTLLGILLEKAGYQHFAYLDNDERKWSAYIHSHVIRSPQDIEKMKNIFIMVPIEYGEAVRQQLLKSGRREKEEFVILKPDIYENFAEEFFRSYSQKRLILGESFLNEVIIEQADRGSMKTQLWNAWGKESTKILSMNCIGMQAFYFLLSLQIKMNSRPEELWLFLNYETMTEHHHLLSRTHHPGILQILQERGKFEDDEFAQYIEYARARAADYRIEQKYSPQRISIADEKGCRENQKQYMKQSMLYELNLDTMESVYFKRLLGLAVKEKIKINIFMTPVNYELADIYYGNEFERQYAENNRKIQQLVESYGGQVINLGKSLKRNFFKEMVTIQDAISWDGMQVLMEIIMKAVKEIE